MIVRLLVVSIPFSVCRRSSASPGCRSGLSPAGRQRGQCRSRRSALCRIADAARAPLEALSPRLRHLRQVLVTRRSGEGRWRRARAIAPPPCRVQRLLSCEWSRDFGAGRRYLLRPHDVRNPLTSIIRQHAWCRAGCGGSHLGRRSGPGPLQSYRLRGRLDRDLGRRDRGLVSRALPTGQVSRLGGRARASASRPAAVLAAPRSAGRATRDAHSKRPSGPPSTSASSCWPRAPARSGGPRRMARRADGRTRPRSRSWRCSRICSRACSTAGTATSRTPRAGSPTRSATGTGRAPCSPGPPVLLLPTPAGGARAARWRSARDRAGPAGGARPLADELAGARGSPCVVGLGDPDRRLARSHPAVRHGRSRQPSARRSLIVVADQLGDLTSGAAIPRCGRTAT